MSSGKITKSNPMQRIAFLWLNYMKHMRFYKAAIKDKRKNTAQLHKKMAEQSLDEYFSDIEKMLL